MLAGIVRKVWHDNPSFIAVGVPLTIAAGFFESLGVGLLLPVLSLLDNPDARLPGPLVQALDAIGLDADFYLLLALVTVSVFLKFFLIFAQQTVMQVAAMRHDVMTKVGLYDAAVRADWRHLATVTAARLTSMVLVEARRSRDVYTALSMLLTASVFVVFYLIVGILVAPSLMVGGAALGAVLAAIFYAISFIATRLGTRLTGENEAAQSRLQEGLFNLKYAKSVGLVDRVARKYRDNAHAVAGTLISIAKLNAFTAAAREPVILTGIVSIVLMGKVVGVTTAILLTTAFIMYRMYGQVMTASQAWQDFCGCYPAWADSVAMIADLEQNAERTGGTPFGGMREGLVLEDVHYAYQSGQPVLKGVSLDIPQGAIVAFIGPSGAGKSTLLDIITGLLVPTGGRIEVDGVALETIDPASFRARIGVVLQEPVLFDGTIADNIRIQRDEATADDVARAARQAHAHTFIERMADGYESQVGERGSRLSVGQRQRVTMARALAGDPSLLILDEATSALDVESENEIKAAIRDLRGRMTVIIVAHRLSTIQDADIVYRIDDGRATRLNADEVASIQRIPS